MSVSSLCPRVAFDLLNFPVVLLMTFAEQDTKPTDAEALMKLAYVPYLY